MIALLIFLRILWITCAVGVFTLASTEEAVIGRCAFVSLLGFLVDWRLSAPGEETL